MVTGSLWRVAIIGSGPAGMYAADALSRREDVQVDIYDRVFAPYGLLRYGVAPDHASIKAVAKPFDGVRSRANVRFFGGVTFGEDVDLETLRAQYHAIIFAVGSSSDRRLGLPGEAVSGMLSSRMFVAWYNGHPDMADLKFPVDAERAVVVGGGNVALDVARILLRPVEELGATDIADHSLAALALSKMREVHLLMRRGPADVAFTLPELRELTKLEGVYLDVDRRSLVLDDADRARIDGDRGLRKIYDVLCDAAERPRDASMSRVLRVHFMTSPLELIGEDRLTSVACRRNEVVDGRLSGVPGSEFQIDATLCIRAIGYQGVALPGLPFDDKRHVIPSGDGGQVMVDGAPLPGVFVSGWARRGPTGVIGTNKVDASEVAAKVLEAFVGEAPPRDAVYADRWALTSDWWDRVDAAERARGEQQGRPRVKFVRAADAHAWLEESRPGEGEA